MPLNTKETLSLHKRGITIETSSSQSDIEVTTKGLALLVNYLYLQKEKKPITSETLKRLSVVEYSESQIRTLKVMFMPVPVYDRNNRYYQVVFYLDGSPPKLFSSLPPEANGLTKKISLTGSTSLIKARGYSSLSLVLTNTQFDSLKAGEVIDIELLPGLKQAS